MSDNTLDAENWKLEAKAVIRDVKDHVKNITLSEQLQSTDQRIYLNLTTLENRQFCIELSGLGFRIVGNEHDKLDIMENEWHETPYSLLNNLSPMFTESFGNSLLQKLNNLAE